VLVATGHHWCPRWPDAAGPFDGEERHARDYRSPEAFAGDRVLVVGIGNTGTGIASDLCRVAETVALSARTPAWIMPKYLLGSPLDQWSGPYMERLPVWTRRWTLQALRWLTVGHQERYGVPTPEHRPLEEHPTLSEEFLAHVDHGRIEMRPGIDHIEGRDVTFADGQAGRFDAILYATGYEISFPFLPDRVFQVGPEEIGLYRYVVPPGQPGLYFLGLVQPAGPLPPLSERQSRWIADLLTGTAALPPAGSVRQWINDERERRRQRYHESPRHRLEIDYWEYVRQLETERARGRRRR
ncbi:MAG: NAD(P)/FAD-dependent oxidoreductase, partial [Salinibacter sp.]